jgi:hypothetical protein
VSVGGEFWARAMGMIELNKKKIIKKKIGSFEMALILMIDGIPSAILTFFTSLSF